MLLKYSSSKRMPDSICSRLLARGASISCPDPWGPTHDDGGISPSDPVDHGSAASWNGENIKLINNSLIIINFIIHYL